MNSEHITQTPGVLGGKPCVAGTRISVEGLQSAHRSGWNVDRILAKYPSLTRDQVRAALAYQHAYYAPNELWIDGTLTATETESTKLWDGVIGFDEPCPDNATRYIRADLISRDELARIEGVQ